VTADKPGVLIGPAITAAVIGMGSCFEVGALVGKSQELQRSLGLLFLIPLVAGGAIAAVVYLILVRSVAQLTEQHRRSDAKSSIAESAPVGIARDSWAARVKAEDPVARARAIRIFVAVIGVSGSIGFLMAGAFAVMGSNSVSRGPAIGALTAFITEGFSGGIIGVFIGVAAAIPAAILVRLYEVFSN
jgi:phosphate/sulfate permease